MSISRRLSDVPEEGSFNPYPGNSPYANPTSSAASSTNTLGIPHHSSRSSAGSKRTPSLRTVGQPSSSNPSPTSASAAPPSPVASTAEGDNVSLGPVKRKSSSNSTRERDPSSRSRRNPHSGQHRDRYRAVPALPHDKDADVAPSTGMYWSRAPVHGHIPPRPMRAHTVTLVDSIAWVLGGWDDREHTKGLKTIYCFDTETMQWTTRDTIGEVPPPSRAHTATLLDRKIIIFGGGVDESYYNTVAILDTTTRHWSRPPISGTPPAPRRSHSAVLYGQKILIFGGGTGVTALNDVWALDVSQPHRLKWEEIKTKGVAPKCRGYHTANLVGHVMIVIGGSDGIALFDDVWLLNLETREWKEVRVDPDLACRRIAHCAAQVGSFLFITGGFDHSNYCSELIPFNLISLQFEKRSTYGKHPSSRGYHATILADSRLFMFGGYDGAMAYDEVWTLDLAAGAYLPQVTSFNINLDGGNLIER